MMDVVRCVALLGLGVYEVIAIAALLAILHSAFTEGTFNGD